MTSPKCSLKRNPSQNLVKLQKNRQILLNQLDELDFTINEDKQSDPLDFDFDDYTTDLSSHDRNSMSTQGTDPGIAYFPLETKSNGNTLRIRRTLATAREHNEIDCQIENALLTLDVLKEIIDIDMAVMENQLKLVVQDLELCKAYDTHIVRRPFEKVFTQRWRSLK